MTPNGHDYTREYGGHKYPKHDGISDCEYGCDCWVGPTRSGGPLGLNPMGGECPNNPKNGKRLSGNDDYEIVVERRIRSLETKAHNAERLLEQVEPGAVELAKEVQNIKRKLFEEQQRSRRAIEALTPPQPETSPKTE